MKLRQSVKKIVIQKDSVRFLDKKRFYVFTPYVTFVTCLIISFSSDSRAKRTSNQFTYLTKQSIIVFCYRTLSG